MKTYLGIDYGQKRIGLSTATTPIAEPYKIIDAYNAIEAIQKIISEQNITEIVVGLSEAETKQKTLEFIDELKKVADLPIHTQDETMTSYEVKQHFLDIGMRKDKLHGHIDHYAAALILQDFLDDNS